MATNCRKGKSKTGFGELSTRCTKCTIFGIAVESDVCAETLDLGILRDPVVKVPGKAWWRKRRIANKVSAKAATTYFVCVVSLSAEDFISLMTGKESR